MQGRRTRAHDQETDDLPTHKRCQCVHACAVRELRKEREREQSVYAEEREKEQSTAAHVCGTIIIPNDLKEMARGREAVASVSSGCVMNDSVIFCSHTHSLICRCFSCRKRVREAAPFASSCGGAHR